MAEDTIVFRLAAPPEALWPYVSATGRLNREVGLPALNYSYAPRPEGGTKLVAKTRKLGLAIEWVEDAFEWVEPEWYLATRRFPKGPIALTHVGAKFRPDGGGTEVTLHHETDTRGLLGAAAVW
ncbi:MAG: hypothetical protein L0216_10580, partial [Planctomycetales bacterium]|nr:hypothetical protein [Planctomycetales bacterium]